MHQPITISGFSSVSALGSTEAVILENYQSGKPQFSTLESIGKDEWVSVITEKAQKDLEDLESKQPKYKNLDRTVLLAILASSTLEKLVTDKERVCINIGSSRGATTLFEKYHREFENTGRVSAYTSPTTTLGNISSWVAQHLKISGFTMGHSVTCSTALHAMINGIAWLQADMADAFIAGGSEAALTPFTLAQMKAMKLYSESENHLACESMRFEKTRNSIVLGEAAAVCLLERGITKRTQAVIKGYGFASEELEHSSSISESGLCFQRAMKMALEKAGLDTVDCIVMHAPGTVKGDLAEKRAIDTIFGNGLPLLTSNKWLLGHTFAASGMMSLQMAMLMLKHNKFIENPYFPNARHLPTEMKSVMVNAVGFGGNAVSIIISNP